MIPRWVSRLTLRFFGVREAPPRLAQAEDHMLYVFAGDFGSAKAARAYCLEPSATHPADAPPQFTVDLPEAFIDISGLHLIHGDRALDDLMMQVSAADAEKLFEQEGTDTWILLTHRAFGGFPFRLHDTPQLTYLGVRHAKEDE